MDKSRTGEIIISQIAKNHGETEEEVRREIEKAIMIAYKEKGNGSKWSEIFGNNVVPTPEEFIEKVGYTVKGR